MINTANGSHIFAVKPYLTKLEWFPFALQTNELVAFSDFLIQNFNVSTVVVSKICFIFLRR